MPQEPASNAWKIQIAVVTVLALVLVGGGAWLLARDDDNPTTHSFVVPPGASAQLEEDPDLSFFPRRLEASVGDEIVIENNDAVLHTVGPFTVDAHQTLRLDLDTPGTYSGLCTLHPDGESEIVVGVS
ncbi:MAG: hypothetical protein R3A49_13455 [Acidimicrobiia bacterium]